MKLFRLVIKELVERKNQLATSLLAITLGIAVIVAIKNIIVYSEKAVAGELDTLGANILILPKSASVQDYYSSDFQDEYIPEDYVTVLLNSKLKGLDNLSPKLSMTVTVHQHKSILTGILPKNEFKAKSSWQGALGVFSKPEGCGDVGFNPAPPDSKKNLVRKRVIDELSEREVLLGHDIARRLKLKEKDSVQISGNSFRVEAVLPQTGTVDDNRIFAHLRVVQKMANRPKLLQVIEIVGCCSAISKGLIAEINRTLPDARVVTITQIVQTQLNTNTLMKNLSLIMLVIIIIIGGASMANYLFANIYERRREIGIIMALGGRQSWIVGLVLMKSVLLGLFGGVCGYIIGTAMAFVLGPQIAGVAVLPLPWLAGYAVALSIAITLVASIIPTLKATKIDPFVIMQEE